MPDMEITDLIRQEAHRYHWETGQEPTRLYLGRQELTALKVSAMSRWALYRSDRDILEFYGMAIVPVAESSHFYLTQA